MRPIGFSTGALALGDFRRGLHMLRGLGVPAVELSALRHREVDPLLSAIESGACDELLAGFAYVSVHAPSSYPPAEEARIAARLFAGVGGRWPVILHPDAVSDFSLWAPFGAALLIENMDRRKPAGKTAAELEAIFARLPEASLCLDIGHAWQVDPSMAEARAILSRYGARLRQLHMSEVNEQSKHRPLGEASAPAFRGIAGLLSEEVPLILETPVERDAVLGEIARARDVLTPIG
jgi:sugar phosphate isomerase/epimerase